MDARAVVCAANSADVCSDLVASVQKVSSSIGAIIQPMQAYTDSLNRRWRETLATATANPFAAFPVEAAQLSLSDIVICIALLVQVAVGVGGQWWQFDDVNASDVIALAMEPLDQGVS